MDPRCSPWDLLELRRLDARYTADALALIGWSIGLVQSWQPLFDAANRILDHFGVEFAPRVRGETVDVGARG